LAKKDFSQREEKVAPAEGNEEELKEEAGDVESLKKALDEEKEKAEKYLANWQRAQADFVNYKRRTEQERAEAAQFSNSTLILSLLPVLDDFERALGSVPAELAESPWVEGVNHIYRKMKAILESQGISAIEAEGKDFDPHFHEAVMTVEGDEGKVIEEISKGYKFGERVLRPSMVKVGKGIANK
jgi:molecular chaperone GrpE